MHLLGTLLEPLPRQVGGRVPRRRYGAGMLPATIAVLSVPADGPARLIEMTFTLDAAQSLVGGNLQALPLTRDSTLYCNEDGKWQGLPVNEAANRLARSASLGLAPDDFIVGTVLVCGTISPGGQCDGDDYDCPPSVLSLCQQADIDVEVT